MTFRDAILRHRGEASNVTEHFENLGEPDQALLSNFLNLSNGKRDSEASSSPYDLIEVNDSVESAMPCRNPMGHQIATDLWNVGLGCNQGACHDSSPQAPHRGYP